MLHIEGGIVGKWIAMLKQIAPRLARVALLANSKTVPYDYFMRSGQAAASSLAIELIPSHVENAADIERVLNSIASVPDSGLILPPDATTVVHRDLIIALATKHHLPAVYAIDTFVAAGGLISYGADQNDMFRLAAFYTNLLVAADEVFE